MQKKSRNAKQMAENAFQFENSSKKGKNGKKKAHLFGFLLLLYPLGIFFLHFKPKTSYKKRQKCKKKQKIIFQKNMQKKAEMQKKGAKKSS